MGQFAVDVRKFCEKAKANQNEATRAIALALLTRIVYRSPVGNPELWARNAVAAQYNREADRQNAELRSDPANLDSRGRLKRGRKIKEKGIHAPAGYVGGRFRGNWQVTISSPASSTLNRIDPNGAETIASGLTALANYKAGPSIYIMNNLPYAIPLEYGHSKQAPNGMVRLAVAEIDQIVAEATRGLKV